LLGSLPWHQDLLVLLVLLVLMQHEQHSAAQSKPPHTGLPVRALLV